MTAGCFHGDDADRASDHHFNIVSIPIAMPIHTLNYLEELVAFRILLLTKYLPSNKYILRFKNFVSEQYSGSSNLECTHNQSAFRREEINGQENSFFRI